MARSVMAETFSFRPTKSASSSMHSWPIMVESMSARNSRLRRLAASWTTTSTGAPPSASARPASASRAQVRAGVDRREGQVGRDARRPATPCAVDGRRQRLARARARRASVSSGRVGFADERGDGSETADGRWRSASVMAREAVAAGRVTGQRSMAGRLRAILIAGPTASGKSALAIALAQRLGGTVVNADSMQVYRDLRILTARPTRRGGGGRAAPAVRPCRRGGEPLGRPLDGGDAGRAGRPRGEGRLPIVTGGTGLYFKALTEGLSRIPAVPDEVRAARARRHGGRAGRTRCIAELAHRDPVDGRDAAPHATGSGSCGRWRCSTRPAGRSSASTASAKGALLDPRAVHSRVPRRPSGSGLLAASTRASTPWSASARWRRCGRSARRDLDPALPVMRAHGVPWLIKALHDEMTLRRGHRARQAGHAPLRQAPVHLVPAPGARLDLGGPGEAGRGAGTDLRAKGMPSCERSEATDGLAKR